MNDYFSLLGLSDKTVSPKAVSDARTSPTITAYQTVVPPLVNLQVVATSAGVEVKWQQNLLAQISYTELRFDDHFGTATNRIDQTKAWSELVTPLDRQGTIYGANLGTDSQYSVLASGEYTYPELRRPEAPTITPLVDIDGNKYGFTVHFQAPPELAMGTHIFVNGKKYQLDSKYNPNDEYTVYTGNGSYDISVGYYDVFGEGQVSDSVHYEDTDGNLVNGNFDKLTANSGNIVNLTGDTLKFQSGDITNLNGANATFTGTVNAKTFNGTNVKAVGITGDTVSGTTASFANGVFTNLNSSTVTTGTLNAGSGAFTGDLTVGGTFSPQTISTTTLTVTGQTTLKNVQADTVLLSPLPTYPDDNQAVTVAYLRDYVENSHAQANSGLSDVSINQNYYSFVYPGGQNIIEMGGTVTTDEGSIDDDGTVHLPSVIVTYPNELTSTPFSLTVTPIGTPLTTIPTVKIEAEAKMTDPSLVLTSTDPEYKVAVKSSQVVFSSEGTDGSEIQANTTGDLYDVLNTKPGTVSGSIKDPSIAVTVKSATIDPQYPVYAADSVTTTGFTILSSVGNQTFVWSVKGVKKSTI